MRLKVVILFVAVAAIAWSGRARAAGAHADIDPAYEATLRADVVRRDPSVVDAWDRGNRAREAGDVAGARAAFTEVTEKLPELDAGHRRLCSVAATPDEAIASCRRALSLKTSWENETALAITLMQRPEGRPEARRLLNWAENNAGREPTVIIALGQLALADQNQQSFLRYADRLAEVAPQHPVTPGFRAIACMMRGDFDGARAALDQAKASGALAPEVIDSLEKTLDSAERSSPLGIAKRLGLFLACWLGLLLFLYAAGSMLSAATLRATAVDAARGAKGEAVGGTRLIKRAYATLITFASLFYYASLPVVGALVLVAVAALVYACLAVGRIPIKLVLIVVVIAAVSLWAIAKSLWISLRPPKQKDPGEEVELGSNPKLDAMLRGVADRIGTRGPSRIFVTAGTDMAVFERGGAIATARGRGERCLVMGAGLLRGMRVGSLKGVLAHELGHFKNEDTAGGALSLAVRRSMIQMLVELVRGGAAAAYNPAWQFALRYHQIFLRISQGSSRLQEVLADRWAVSAYGSKPFVDGFEHVIARSIEHDAHLQATLQEVIKGDRPLLNMFTYEPEVGPVSTALAEKQREAREAESDPYDSHPPPKDRIAAALALAVEHTPEEGDDLDAWLLFEDREALEQRLTDRVCEAVAENHAVVIRRTAPATA